MSLRFIDGFDHYDTAHLKQKWTDAQTSSGNGVIAAAARTGGQGCRLAWTDYLSKTLTDGQSELILGFAARMNGTISIQQGVNYGQLSVQCPLIYFMSGAYVQALVSLDSSGSFTVFTFSSANTPFSRSDVQGSVTQTGPGGQALSSGAWKYIEVKAVCSATAGQVVIRADGVPILTTAATLNTNSGGTGSFNNVTIDRRWTGPNGSVGELASGITLDIDDVYVADGQTAGAHDFIGNISVNALLPNGAGAVTQFSPTGAATDWQAVSETPPNDDTSYAGSSTVGNQDLYTVPAPPVTAGPVAAVAVNMWARTDDGGAHVLQPLVRTGTTTAGGPTTGGNINTGYQDAQVIMETNPANGSAAFTLSEISTDQFGVQYAS